MPQNKLMKYISNKGFTLNLSLRDILCLSLLVIVALIRYNSVLDAFWLADDTQILKYTITHPPLEYFFSPKAWQESSSLSFTPWVIFSFDADWNIFGLSPYGFYLHHLISLCLVAISSYVVLRLWFSAMLSFFGTLVFIVSPPFAEFAQFLMVRHYIEGLFFTFLSLYCFITGVRKNKLLLSIFGAMLYLLACSAKEIYAPLVFFIVIFPEVKWQKRLYHVLPFVCAAIVYVLWRTFMLGALTGGYEIPLVWPQDFVLLPQRIADAMGGGLSGSLIFWWRLFIGCSFLVIVVALFKVNKRGLFYLFVFSFLILLPIVPVSPVMATRYVWLLTVCWGVVNVVMFNDILLRIKGRLFVQVAVYSLGLILVGGFFYFSSAYMENMKLTVDSYKKEGVFFLQTGGRTDLLVNPAGTAWHFKGLSWIRTQVLHMSEGPSVTFDDKLFCLEGLSNKKYKSVWMYNFQNKMMVSSDFIDYFNHNVCRDTTDKIRLGAPLSLSIRYNKRKLTWKWGPYKNGQYAWVFGPEAESVYLLSPDGSRAAPLADSTIQFRLRYSAPEGWLAYSPLLELKISSDKGSLEWKR